MIWVTQWSKVPAKNALLNALHFHIYLLIKCEGPRTKQCAQSMDRMMVALLIQRSWWEKLVIILSGLPIALLCNSLRLTITASAFTFSSLKNWEGFFHDFGGYAMMPLALGMVIGELWLLARLTTPPAEAAPAVIARRRPRHVPDS